LLAFGHFTLDCGTEKRPCQDKNFPNSSLDRENKLISPGIAQNPPTEAKDEASSETVYSVRTWWTS